VVREVRSLNLGLGVTMIVILALAGYWSGELVYAYRIGVEAVMFSGLPNSSAFLILP
jgi:uncharacterized membrane protein